MANLENPFVERSCAPEKGSNSGDAPTLDRPDEPAHQTLRPGPKSHPGTARRRKSDHLSRNLAAAAVPSTHLPDFKSVNETTARIGHNSAAPEDTTRNLNDLRRILVGPTNQKMEARLEELVSILEEREAELVNRESAVHELVVLMEKRLSEVVVQAESKHDQLIIEIGHAISTLGNEISALGGRR